MFALIFMCVPRVFLSGFEIMENKRPSAPTESLRDETEYLLRKTEMKLGLEASTKNNRVVE